MPEGQYVRWLGELSATDTGVVGGKNASLGEMIGALKKRKIRVPDGFATTAEAYRAFLDENDLQQEIEARLSRPIGSNDLTQLVLGVDRDSTDLAYLFDESHEAVRDAIEAVIRAAHKAKRKVGICGEAPSNNPDFAAFLVRSGIDSISLSPDSVLEVKRRIAKVEKS